MLAYLCWTDVERDKTSKCVNIKLISNGIRLKVFKGNKCSWMENSISVKQFFTLVVCSKTCVGTFHAISLISKN